MNSIIISPHNDDSELFASYVLQRYKPLVVVVTDSFIQYERGQTDITAHRRRDETRAACKVLGLAAPVFLGQADDCLTFDAVEGSYYAVLSPSDTVFCPAIQGGHPHHDMIRETLAKFWEDDVKVIEYATYAKDCWYTPLEGGIELVPTPEEFALKERALACYTSQLWQPHFPAVLKARSEWISKEPHA